jgi:hypothetical protein
MNNSSIRKGENGTIHLAQINVAEAKAEMDTEMMSGFVSRLDEINALADSFSGFIWRMQSEEDEAKVIRVFDNSLLLVNMSVWENVESLQNFVYKSTHVELIQNRDAWFDKFKAAHQALWWIPAGHIPTVEEGKERLDYIQLHGPGEYAFTFSRPIAAAG